MKGEFFCDGCRSYKKISLKDEDRTAGPLKKPVCTYCAGQINTAELKIAEERAKMG